METDDATRELDKIRDALKWAAKHERLTSESNAALHCNDTVLYSTLYQRLAQAQASADKLVAFLERLQES